MATKFIYDPILDYLRQIGLFEKIELVFIHDANELICQFEKGTLILNTISVDEDRVSEYIKLLIQEIYTTAIENNLFLCINSEISTKLNKESETRLFIKNTHGLIPISNLCINEKRNRTDLEGFYFPRR